MTNASSFVGSFTSEGAVGVASLDPPLVQQTKSEIRTLASEIAKLAQAAFEPEEFYSGFLPRLVTAMGAEAAAVWQTCHSLQKRGSLALDDSGDGQMASGILLQADHALPAELLSTKNDSIFVRPSESHRRILECVIAEGAPILVPPRTVVSMRTGRPIRLSTQLSSSRFVSKTKWNLFWRLCSELRVVRRHNADTCDLSRRWLS